MSDRKAIQFDSPDELLIVGFDSEYEPGEQRNQILTYQTRALYRGREWGCFYEQRGERLTLAEVLARTLEEGKRVGAFNQYPTELCLAVHWSLADLTMLRDFSSLKDKFDGLRKTYATVAEPHEITWTDSNRHQRQLKVYLVDTKLLAPAGGKLADIGVLHGLPKLELPPGVIENMGRFLKDQPKEFEEYAMRDAEIAAKHTLYMVRFQQKFVGACKIPITLGGLAKDYAIALWKRTGLPWAAALGFRVITKQIFTEKRCRTIEAREPLPGFNENSAIALQAYHGGRNECYIFGASPVGRFNDFDLSGAYPTGLSTIEQPDYAHIQHTTNPADFGAGTIGFARLSFKFPETVRFPCLPCRTDHGLVFPLTGVTTATAPEIYLAIQLGAEVVIEEGIVIPTKPVKIFREVVADLTALRTKHETDPLLNALFKEMNNSLYGKLGQGLRKRNVFDTRTGVSKQMPKSQLANPYMAAHVTGFIRAVLAEIMNGLPGDCLVVSATTDGFITTATEEQAELATRGTLAQQFAQARMNISGSAKILEVKRRAGQILAWRTRGAATLQYFERGKLVLAKAGLRAPEGISSSESQNGWIVQSFTDRSTESTYSLSVFKSLREIWHEESDLTRREIVRRLGMDFDWKRKPAEVGIRNVNGVPLLCFTTKPLSSVEDFKRYRAQWDVWQRETKRCLKTEDDLRDFITYLNTAQANHAGVYRSMKLGPVKLALRQLRRAFATNAWGIVRRGMSYGAFAEFLSSGGYQTSTSDVKNAARAKLVRHLVPVVPDVLRLIQYVMSRFPTFQADLLLCKPGDPAVKPKGAVQSASKPAKRVAFSHILIFDKLSQLPSAKQVANGGVKVPL